MSAPRKYDQETRDRAVGMYVDRIGQGDISQRGTRIKVGELLGVYEATLRNWVSAQVGEGATPAASGGARVEEFTELHREIAELCRANEILRTHIFFPPPRSRAAS